MNHTFAGEDPLREIFSAARDHLIYHNEKNVKGLSLQSPTEEMESVENGSVHVSPDLSMEEIRNDLGDCKRCKLHQQRHHIVFGEGSFTPEIVFVGEGPGQQEDQQGRPFVGRAGQLLDRIIAAMGMERSDVYICNIVKCRPPGNRNPEPDEIQTCSPFLNRQLTVLQPRVICALGNVAATYLLGIQSSMIRMRGKYYDYEGFPVRPTYHPAALLRNPKYRRPVWEDMQEIMQFLGKPISAGKS